MNTKAIQDILVKLNDKQQEAVEKIEGPVMVVAGPGTGKTQILSARIANILTETDAAPENILCLTYTEAGVTAMLNRLISMIGSEAYKVKINTFHSLGAQIIRENEEVFGMRGLQPVSDLEKEEILRALLDELPYGSLLKTNKDYYYHTKNLAQIFGLIKSEAIDIESFIGKIDAFIEEMPHMEEYQYKRKSGENQKGDPKWGDINKKANDLAKLKEVLNLFPVFDQKMRSRNRFDFDDMLLWVLKAFKSNPDLLLQYQEKYHYFLVDEFQDTNGTQVQLLYLLGGYWDSPNLFVVGDDDQSIYKFQGANVGNIIDFATKFQKDTQTIVLEQNYRSSQLILDAAGALIASNIERLVSQLPGSSISKDLKACSEEVKHLTQKPLLIACQNETQEAVHIANQIKELINNQSVDPSHIAVIYRNHRQSEEITRFLLSKEIPVYAVRAVNILEEPFIQNLLHVLTYLQMESEAPFTGDHLLFPILNTPIWNLASLDIAKLSFVLSRSSEKKWRAFLGNLHAQVVAEANITDPEFLSKIKQVHGDLEFWISQASNLTVSDLMEKVISKGGFLGYALKSDDKTWYLQLLKTMFDFVKEETARNPYITLSELIKTVQTMQELGIRIEVKRVFGSSNGVKMLTAHASKGLEFDYVFMIACNNKVWAPKDRNLPYGMSLIFTQANETVSSEEESRRLFYVAMTRAKKFLQISWAEEKDNPSIFVTELKATHTCEEQFLQADENDTAAFLEAQFLDISQQQKQMAEDAWLNRFLENYSMSVTHLSQYLKCPVAFYYEKVLRVPAAQSMHAGFGSAIHSALEEFLKAAKKSNPRVFWDATKLCEEFEKQLFYQRGSFTKENYEHMLTLGKDKLTQYYNRRIEHIKQVPEFTTEERFKADLDGLELTGMADKIEIDGKHANLIDYKTGDPKRGKSKLNPPDPNADEDAKFEKKYGGDYWRQIVFYKLLTDLAEKNTWTMQSGEVDFIEEEETITDHHRIFVSQDDIELLKAQIKEAEAGIKAKKFRNGCRDSNCQWCNFETFYLDANNRNYDFGTLQTVDTD